MVEIGGNKTWQGYQDLNGIIDSRTGLPDLLKENVVDRNSVGNGELVELVVKRKGFWRYGTCVGSDETLPRMLTESVVEVRGEI